MCNRVLEYDASNSWSGFNYQGKVAIYVALKKINCLYESEEQGRILNYYLELEWLEDFSILYESDKQRNYESIHQVKARAYTNISDYAEALAQLFTKLDTYPNISGAYLHTMNLAQYPKGGWIDSIKTAIVSGNSFSSRIREINDYIEAPTLHADLVKRISQAKRSNSFISDFRCSIEKSQLEGKISEINVIHALELYKRDVQDCLDHFVGGISQSNLEKTYLFNYADQTEPLEYCPLDYIDSLIDIEILNYWRKFPAFSWKPNDDELLHSIHQCLAGEIDQHIMKRHLQYGKNPDRLIPLSRIEEILSSDEPTKRCKEYYLYLLKSNLFDFCNDYHSSCLEVCQAQGDLECCEYCQIYSFYGWIRELTIKY